MAEKLSAELKLDAERTKPHGLKFSPRKHVLSLPKGGFALSAQCFSAGRTTVIIP